MSFSRAIESCELLLKLVTSTDDALYSPLSTAALIYYARPFKYQRGASRLEASWVPSEHGALHQGLIDARDKLIAHSDADDYRQFGVALNQVIYSIDSRLDYMIQEARLAVPHFVKIQELLTVLLDKARNDVAEIHKRHSECFPISGVHQLDLKSEDVFVPVLSWDSPLHPLASFRSK